MKSLSEIVLNSVALLEAEGRLMRAKTIATGSAVVAILIGGLFLFAACLVAGFAAFVYLGAIYGEVIAALAVAGGLALIGIILLLNGNSKR